MVVSKCFIFKEFCDLTLSFKSFIGLFCFVCVAFIKKLICREILNYRYITVKIIIKVYWFSCGG